MADGKQKTTLEDFLPQEFTVWAWLALGVMFVVAGPIGVVMWCLFNYADHKKQIKEGQKKEALDAWRMEALSEYEAWKTDSTI